MSQYDEFRKQILDDPEHYDKFYNEQILEATDGLNKCFEKGFSNINPRTPNRHVYENRIYYIYKYVYDGLNGDVNTHYLSMYCRILIDRFVYLTKTYNYIPTNLTKIDARHIGELLAITAVTGWKDQFDLMSRLCFKHLHDFMGDAFGVQLKWYMLLISHDFLNAKIELESPHNPLEGGKINPVWRHVIINWREPDPLKFNQMMGDMADYHVSQCDYGDDDHIYEFENDNYWLFPIEILALLRIREWANIPNPTLTHPFFATSKLMKLQPVPEWPKDEILDKVHDEFVKLYPDLPSIKDLPTLRQEQS